MNFNPNANPYAMQDANFARMQAALTRDEAERDFWDEHYPEWREQSRDPEVRDLIAEGDVALVTAQDRADLQVVLDWEEYHI